MSDGSKKIKQALESCMEEEYLEFNAKREKLDFSTSRSYQRKMKRLEKAHKREVALSGKKSSVMGRLLRIARPVCTVSAVALLALLVLIPTTSYFSRIFTTKDLGEDLKYPADSPLNNVWTDDKNCGEMSEGVYEVSEMESCKIDLPSEIASMFTEAQMMPAEENNLNMEPASRGELGKILSLLLEKDSMDRQIFSVVLKLPSEQSLKDKLTRINQGDLKIDEKNIQYDVLDCKDGFARHYARLTAQEIFWMVDNGVSCYLLGNYEDHVPSVEEEEWLRNGDGYVLINGEVQVAP